MVELGRAWHIVANLVGGICSEDGENPGYCFLTNYYSQGIIQLIFIITKLINMIHGQDVISMI